MAPSTGPCAEITLARAILTREVFNWKLSEDSIRAVTREPVCMAVVFRLREKNTSLQYKTKDGLPIIDAL